MRDRLQPPRSADAYRAATSFNVSLEQVGDLVRRHRVEVSWNFDLSLHETNAPQRFFSLGIDARNLYQWLARLGDDKWFAPVHGVLNQPGQIRLGVVDVVNLQTTSPT